MPVLATMVVEYVADTTGLAKGVADVGMLVASAAVAAGVASVKMAGDFQSSMTQLVTGAGESASNLKMVSDGILAMAPAVGETTNQLAAGMYMIESAGFHGADGLTVLKDAAEGAKVGNADLETTAQAVTGAMLNYKSSNLTAAQATNDLIATVGAGQVKLQDLALAMATVEPIAAKSGVSLTDISAAMATMTAKTIPAADAATYLRQTIMAIENPTTKAQDEFKAMGLSSAQVAAEMKISLPDALKEITDAAGKKFPVGSAQYIAAIANMVGGTKSMQGIMNLTGSDMATFQKNVEDISGKVKAGGDSILGWSMVQGDFNQKMAQAAAAVQVLMIQIGTMLLPVLSQILDKVTPVIQSFAAWISSGHALSDVMNALSPIISFLGPLFVGLGQAVVNLANAAKPFIPIAIQIGQILGTIIVFAVGAMVASLTVLINIIASVISFFEHNQAAASALSAVLLAIAVFALPALLIALGELGVDLIATGVESVVAGAKMAGSFVASLIETSMEGWAAVGSIGGFIGSMVKMGVQAVETGAIMVQTFVASLIETASQAITTGSILVQSFIASLIEISSQAIETGVIMVQSFIASLIETATEAIASAAVIMTTVVPALIAVAAEALLTAAPFILIGIIIAAVIIGIILAIQHWSQIVTWFQGVWNATWNAVSTFFTGLWNGIIAFLQNAWNVIVNIVKVAAAVLFVALTGPFGLLVIFIITHWTEVQQFLTNSWNTIVNLATNLVNGIRTAWNALASMATNAFDAMVRAVQSSVNGLISWVFNAGANIVNSIANGIRSAIGAVTSAISSVTQAIANFLPHSPAKMGPLMDLQQTGTEISNQISKGMINGAPLINSAIGNLTKPISLGIKGVSSASPTTLQGGTQDNSVHIYLDGKEMTQQVMKRAVRDMRGHGLKK